MEVIFKEIHQMTAPHSESTWEMARSEPDPVMRLRPSPRPFQPPPAGHHGELPPEACLAVRTSRPGAQVEPPLAPAPGTLAGGQLSVPPHTCRQAQHTVLRRPTGHSGEGHGLISQCRLWSSTVDPNSASSFPGQVSVPW